MDKNYISALEDTESSLNKKIISIEKYIKEFSLSNSSNQQKILSKIKIEFDSMKTDLKLMKTDIMSLTQNENKTLWQKKYSSFKSQKEQKIRVNMNKDRKIMEDKKRNDLINLEKQKNKNSNLKNKIDISLKNWKTNVSKKNKDEADKIKEERNQIRSLINETKEKNSNINKEMHDFVQLSHLQIAEQKRNEEYQKKLKLKREIEEQIQKELALKNELELKINDQQKKNQEIIERLRNYNESSANNSQRNFNNRNSKTPKKFDLKLEKKK